MKQICSICKNPYEPEDYKPIPIMISKGICMDCTYWETVYEKAKDVGIIAVQSKNPGTSAEHNPRTLGIIPFHTRGMINSNLRIFQGLDRILQPTYKILFFTGELYTVFNYFKIGIVPPKFYDKFPVNSVILSNSVCMNLIARKDTKIAKEGTNYIINKKVINNLI